MKQRFFSMLLLTACCTAWAVRPHITFITPSIVRVVWCGDDEMPVESKTGICSYTPQKVDFQTDEDGTAKVYTSTELIVRYDTVANTIDYIHKPSKRKLLSDESRSSEVVISERIIYDESSARIIDTANGQVTIKDEIRRDTLGQTTRYTLNFANPGTKAIYGLGSNMEDYMNLSGKTVWLTQHNLKISMPVLVSPQGYGLLFDAGCAMKFSSGDKMFSMQLDAAPQPDYYFIAGENMADLSGGYRYLTGNVQLLPLYSFGYVQSKERYTSSDELISVVREYRRRNIPLDMIVQDWNYWPQGWGYMKMDEKFYPDKRALTDTIHALNARLMVSIWPNPQECPEADDFKARGLTLEHSVYDAFSNEGRQLYWQYVDNEFFSNGFDAWWCDSSEPVDGDWNYAVADVNGEKYGWNHHEQRWKLCKDILSESLGAERSSLYSLYHSKGIYENQRATDDRRRVLNLTRSSYPGQQRYGTMVWNGDTHASWKCLQQQIPSGLNYMATGNPYWTVDVGAFFTRNDGHRWFYTGEFPDGSKDDDYREFYTRMFQWATFLPMLRSHGTDTPREIWRFGEPCTPYYDAILDMIKLRYSLMPYIYSMAAAQYSGNYSMARLLAFDYPDDEAVYDIKDQYMFGDILVCPVTAPMQETQTRRVYLPSGNRWHEYGSEKIYNGGQWITIPVKLESIPLFIREGSIIPVSDGGQYAAEALANHTNFHIYPGADAEFILYYDDGESYDFEKGYSCRIPIKYSHADRKVTIGDAEGSYPGMPSERVFRIIMPGENAVSVCYKGKAVVVDI